MNLAEIAACQLSVNHLHLLWQIPLGVLGGIVLIALAAFLFLWIACLLVDQRKPQKHDNAFYRGLMTLYIRVIMIVLRVRVHTKGLEQTPKNGRFLLVCNHLSDADPVILNYLFRKSQLSFITKRENTSMFIVGPIMHKTMCQPINRENDREALKTILECIRLIKEDEVSIAVFPEGYIRDDGLLHHFRSGVFKIAQRTNVPIVVCTIRNPAQIFENLPKLKPTEVWLNLVKTIQPEEYAGMNTVQIAEMVHELMARDLGADLVAEE